MGYEPLLKPGIHDIPADKIKEIFADSYVALRGNEDERAYRRGNFGFSREEQPQGIARVIIGNLAGPAMHQPVESIPVPGLEV
jgi:hypothetical protein